MASEPEVSEISSLFERLVRNRDMSMSLFLPFLFGYSEASLRGDREDPDQESDTTEGSQRQRIILVNPFTQGMVVIDGVSSLEALFREIGSNTTKGGFPPATKESIEALPSVEIGEDDDGGKCVVCLEEFEVGGVVKEMPCKHRFHCSCIEKWLGIHGSCPVCRYEMPIDEGKKREEEEEGGGERRRVGNGEVWVSFSFNGSRRSQDQNQEVASPSGGDSSDSSSSDPRGDAEVES